jgi:hypothetical protein
MESLSSIWKLMVKTMYKGPDVSIGLELGINQFELLTNELGV